MKKITRDYELFSFDELDEKGKEKAINDEISFNLEMCEFGDDDDPENDDIYMAAARKADKNQTPWFAGSIAYEDSEAEIVELIRNRGEVFLKDGSYFS